MKLASLSALVVLAATSVLTACAPPPPPTDANGQVIPTDSDKGYVVLPGMGQKKCIPEGRINVIGTGANYELTGDQRDRFLLPFAQKAGIRVTTSGSTVTDYGSVNIYYYAPDMKCLVWFESLTIQEYGVKLGLDPIGVSPFYQPDVKVEEKK
jgi:hypothetical protein